ncbi:host attachment family protein [Aminobacter ciceronei]|jgi:protein required for attachment to host cells|uniref:Protein required for attachment to host cells n=1 Tax=Aminobacter ciceronei TaxID=150723 RepID=A0ABR6C4T4_9HYPH|nr:host attachment protein [Aminobacter ciceronei]MBA8906224.1 protein required for attachment to host cells [Aminobacter ciceronei]MBA9020003.1 protein required for attachment to host cells [Aminobacter ciceronei]
MLLPKGTVVAVADGEKINLFRNTGDEAGLKLVAMPHQAVAADAGTSMGRQASAANPDHGQAGEDQFSAGIVQHLNQQALSGEIEHMVIVAAPRALGEMRKHYHKALSAILLGEIAKDLTGHSQADVEKALAGG